MSQSRFTARLVGSEQAFVEALNDEIGAAGEADTTLELGSRASVRVLRVRVRGEVAARIALEGEHQGELVLVSRDDPADAFLFAGADAALHACCELTSLPGTVREALARDLEAAARETARAVMREHIGQAHWSVSVLLSLLGPEQTRLALETLLAREAAQAAPAPDPRGAERQVALKADMEAELASLPR